MQVRAWNDRRALDVISIDSDRSYDNLCCIDSDSLNQIFFDPIGNKILVGSTGDLTIKGFAEYLEQVMAFGANIGVQFPAYPNEARRFG